MPVRDETIKEGIRAAITPLLEPGETLEILAYGRRIVRGTMWVPLGYLFWKGHGVALTDRRLLLTTGGGTGMAQRARSELAFSPARAALSTRRFKAAGFGRKMGRIVLASSSGEGPLDLTFYRTFNDEWTEIADRLTG